jgi:hypothetical protein
MDRRCCSITYSITPVITRDNSVGSGVVPARISFDVNVGGIVLLCFSNQLVRQHPFFNLLILTFLFYQ